MVGNVTVNDESDASSKTYDFVKLHAPTDLIKVKSGAFVYSQVSIIIGTSLF